MIEQTPTNRFDAEGQMLIRQMAAGTSGALDDFYAQYSRIVFSFLMARLEDRTLAEEVLQDVMLAAWRAAGSFRGESKVLTWLLTIARNRATNTRRKRTLSAVPLTDAVEATSGDTGPLERLVRQGEYEKVRDKLNQLPAQQREVLVLVFYHQLSEAEVAEVLDIPAGTVKSRLHRGKEMLRRALQSEASY